MSSWRLVVSTPEAWSVPLWDEGGPAPADPGADRIVHLILDADHSANALSEPVIEELSVALDETESIDAKALVVWSGKSQHFIAGADIDEIDRLQFPESATEKAERAQAVFDRLARSKTPTFAAIRGTCLGGGYELALACQYRIAVDHPSTRIGLPEVNLGIIPGFGGTQRLPRLIGIRAGLAAILGGARLPATAAYRKGWVDVVVPEDGHVGAILTTVARVTQNPRSIATRRKKLRGGFVSWLLEGQPFGRALIRRQVSQQIAAKTGGHYPAPSAALDSVMRGVSTSLAEGLRIEAAHLGPLVASPESKNLISVFRASEEARKLRAFADEEETIPEGSMVGVLGAGVMGAGIATVALEKEYAVRLRDLEWDAIGRALEGLGDHFEARVRKRRMTPRERDATLTRLTTTTAAHGFSNCSIVVEAIVERMDVKRAALQELEPQLPDHAIFATNTSALSVSELQESATHPERVVGLHFFNPVPRMPLVEVIAGKHSDRGAVAAAARWAASLGKYPVVVADAPGFVVNRLLMPYLDSACRILERGVPGTLIDEVAVRFGLPMGPFRLLDEVGLDVAAEVSGTLHDAFGERAEPAPTLTRLLEQGGATGKKGGFGFYDYRSGAPTFRPEATAGVTPTGDLPTPKAIVHYLLDRMIDEAARVLDEGVIATASELDLAMVMGTGFPPFRGGPLRYADGLGIPSVVERLRERVESGEAAEPSAALVRMAREGESFHLAAGADASVAAH